ncbi:MULTISPECIES: mandelate racemase/muconate lactonizing enzyme family protein [Microbacterium]|uniref:D-galactonate dehydratase n=1 Tax=Microbacterium azadirachtae TaxID=582680 RepID=A0A0F0LSR3_9MICO|nr:MULTISPECIES: mandelate racemase/muconate lactonizing enzyme family protein [Microbacterium]KJL36272.1 D-galactonate dehydratase [Microbacterium azadirachtae]PRB05357.1 mandelate racemase/muconate lactonizing enzyme family protein [Microbacterium sp. MYb64]
MKITRVQTFPLFLSREDADDSYAGDTGVAHRGYVIRPPWRSLYSPGYETLLVKIETDEGLVGWGEALAPVAPEVVAAVVDHLLAPLILGEDPRSVRTLWHRMTESMRERGHLTGHQADAMAAVDIALWDLWGHATGLSVSELAGGRFAEILPTYVSGIRGNDDAERVDKATAFVESGVRRIKLHLGTDIRTDLATYDAIRAVHPDLDLALDAHWTYRLGEAKALGRELDDRRAWFFEAPLAPEDVEGHRDLAASLATPIAIGEAMRSRFEFTDWLARRAVGLTQPDIGRTGITEGLAIAAVADAFHAQVAPHHSAAFGLAMAAGVHVAASATSLLAFEYQPFTLPVANLILTTPLEVRPDGGFIVPTGPGLGVTVDEAAVAQFVRR